MQFLINAPTRKAKRRKSGKRRTAAQRAATARMLAANKARRRTSTGGTSMAAKRKRRRKASTKAAPRRRRRSTRRNPGILTNPRRRRRATAKRRTTRRRRVRRNPSIGGAVKLIQRGVQDAAVMVGGEMASNIIAGYIPAFLKDESGAESPTGASLRKVIAAAVVGYGAQMIFKGGDIARIAVAGALASPLKAFVRPLLPSTGIFAGALSSYPMPFGVSGYLSSYPMPRLAGYPRGLGCDDAADPSSQQSVNMMANGQY